VALLSEACAVGMKLEVDCCSEHKGDERPVRFRLDGKTTWSKTCSISGTGGRIPISKSGQMMAISISSVERR
jgi:hypothetical protein